MSAAGEFVKYYLKGSHLDGPAFVDGEIVELTVVAHVKRVLPDHPLLLVVRDWKGPQLPGAPVVSAGEPVAWEAVKAGTHGGPRFTDSPLMAERLAENGREVSPLFRSAPVVLPEEPPADLIEAMARVAWESGGSNGFAWRDCDVDERDLYLMEARANYAALRAWVAAGGETR